MEGTLYLILRTEIKALIERRKYRMAYIKLEKIHQKLESQRTHLLHQLEYNLYRMERRRSKETSKSQKRSKKARALNKLLVMKTRSQSITLKASPQRDYQRMEDSLEEASGMGIEATDDYWETDAAETPLKNAASHTEATEATSLIEAVNTVSPTLPVQTQVDTGLSEDTQSTQFIKSSQRGTTSEYSEQMKVTMPQTEAEAINQEGSSENSPIILSDDESDDESEDNTDTENEDEVNEPFENTVVDENERLLSTNSDDSEEDAEGEDEFDKPSGCVVVDDHDRLPINDKSSDVGLNRGDPILYNDKGNLPFQPFDEPAFSEDEETPTQISPNPPVYLPAYTTKISNEKVHSSCSPSRTSSRNRHKRKIDDQISWADPEFQEQALSELDRTWQRLQVKWIELQPFRKRIMGTDIGLDSALMKFKESMRRITNETEDQKYINTSEAIELDGYWKNVKQKLREVDDVEYRGEKVSLSIFSSVLGELGERAALCHCILEFPSSVDSSKKKKQAARRN